MILSAGLLMTRITPAGLEYFLVHPGGPFFTKKDLGVWTIPKGIPENNESLLAAAQREFREETGITPTPPFHEIGTVKQKGGKIVHAWTFRGTWDPQQGLRCNTFLLEWPPRSGRKVQFPEVDKAGWFGKEEASKLMIAEQVPFLQRASEAPSS